MFKHAHIKSLLTVALFGLSACQLGGPKADTALAVEAMKTLSDDVMQGRRVGTDGAARARAYIAEVATTLNRGTEPDILPFSRQVTRRGETQTISGRNIVVTIPGREPDGPILVVTAHYDHVGIIDGEIYNGADDNASGVGALLSILKSFRETPPEHEVQLVWFDGEEFGLTGAVAYVGAITDDRPRLVMNMDMISQNADGVIYAAGTYHTPALKPLIERAAQRSGMTVRFGHDQPDAKQDDWTHSSDHAPFHARGIPFLYYGVQDHEHYHRPTDDFATIPLDVYRKSVQLMVSTAHAFDERLDDLARSPTPTKLDTGP